MPEEQAPEEGQEWQALFFDRLEQAGINTALGMDYCGGEGDFYREMLRIFRDQSGDKKAEIISFYEEANWADYAVKVHALKSTSLTIGAEKLSAQAKELELAGKRADEAYIRQNHGQLLRLYEETCASLIGI